MSTLSVHCCEGKKGRWYSGLATRLRVPVPVLGKRLNTYVWSHGCIAGLYLSLYEKTVLGSSNLADPHLSEKPTKDF